MLAQRKEPRSWLVTVAGFWGLVLTNKVLTARQSEGNKGFNVENVSATRRMAWYVRVEKLSIKQITTRVAFL